ncbi:MAG: hypothetical protein KC416_11080 [Myxococcales bacterium]|nr:hypothetical protein [Myxococcales bacterium]
MRLFVGIAATVLSLAYPFLVYLGLTHFDGRVVAVALLAVASVALLLRLGGRGPRELIHVLPAPLSVAVVALLGMVFDDDRFVLFMPVLINLALFASFAMTLRGETTMVERFARTQDPDLSAPKVAHCRAVTQAWCLFFLLNATAAGVLAWLGPLQWWTIYTGGVAYGLMGLMFAGEMLIRAYRFRSYGQSLPDRALALLFPPKAEEP